MRKSKKFESKLYCLLRIFIYLSFSSLVYAVDNTTIVQSWNDFQVNEIRMDNPNPPVHARNLFHGSALIYDIYCNFFKSSSPYLFSQEVPDYPSIKDFESAVDFAMYTFIRNRYKQSRNYPNTLFDLQLYMLNRGYDLREKNINNDPFKIYGISVAHVYLQTFTDDGSLETGDGIVDLDKDREFDAPYHDSTYISKNTSLVISEPINTFQNIDNWQPLSFDLATTQNGLVANQVQSFLGAQWGNVTPFSLTTDNIQGGIYFNPGSPPTYANDRNLLLSELEQVLEYSRRLIRGSSPLIDISPLSIGNNVLGSNSGRGYIRNPITKISYQPNIVVAADYYRAIAEYWADGPNSETPPGHWNLIAKKISEKYSSTQKIFGHKIAKNRLEWDAKLYFSLNGALHDAAIAAWACKRFYDSARPISYIRNLGYSYSPHYQGSSSYSFNDNITQFQIYTKELAIENNLPTRDEFVNTPILNSWKHLDEFSNESSNKHLILAASWFPYQADTFVTPAFPGYVSGHSCFSRAAAELLSSFCDSPWFPDGIFEIHVKDLEFDSREFNPVTLQHASFFDASDEAGISRIYGGIHINSDDIQGRWMGSMVGKNAARFAKSYFTEEYDNTEQVSCQMNSRNHMTLKFTLVPGRYYQVKYTHDFKNTFIYKSFRAHDKFFEMEVSLDSLPNKQNSTFFYLH